MAKKPEPPKPTSWNIYKIVSNGGSRRWHGVLLGCANPIVNTRPPANRSQAAGRAQGNGDVINRLRARALVVPGIALFGQTRQDVQVAAPLGKTQYQYTLRDPNVAELFQWAPTMLAKLATLP
jgi:multidrug efflux pump subunit AcrB